MLLWPRGGGREKQKQREPPSEWLLVAFLDVFGRGGQKERGRFELLTLALQAHAEDRQGLCPVKYHLIASMTGQVDLL